MEALDTTTGLENSRRYSAISSPAVAVPPPEFTRRTTALMCGFCSARSSCAFRPSGLHVVPSYWMVPSSVMTPTASWER